MIGTCTARSIEVKSPDHHASSKYDTCEHAMMYVCDSMFDCRILVCNRPTFHYQELFFSVFHIKNTNNDVIVAHGGLLHGINEKNRLTDT